VARIIASDFRVINRETRTLSVSFSSNDSKDEKSSEIFYLSGVPPPIDSSLLHRKIENLFARAGRSSTFDNKVNRQFEQFSMTFDGIYRRVRGSSDSFRAFVHRRIETSKRGNSKFAKGKCAGEFFGRSSVLSGFRKEFGRR